MDDIQKLQELKVEIETLKTKLRHCLDEALSTESIMELNVKIDELIVQYHLMKNEKQQKHP